MLPYPLYPYISKKKFFNLIKPHKNVNKNAEIEKIDKYKLSIISFVIYKFPIHSYQDGL